MSAASERAVAMALEASLRAELGLSLAEASVVLGASGWLVV